MAEQRSINNFPTSVSPSTTEPTQRMFVTDSGFEEIVEYRIVSDGRDSKQFYILAVQPDGRQQYWQLTYDNVGHQWKLVLRFGDLPDDPTCLFSWIPTSLDAGFLTVSKNSYYITLDVSTNPFSLKVLSHTGSGKPPLSATSQINWSKGEGSIFSFSYGSKYYPIKPSKDGRELVVDEQTERIEDTLAKQYIWSIETH